MERTTIQMRVPSFRDGLRFRCHGLALLITCAATADSVEAQPGYTLQGNQIVVDEPSHWEAWTVNAGISDIRSGRLRRPPFRSQRDQRGSGCYRVCGTGARRRGGRLQPASCGPPDRRRPAHLLGARPRRPARRLVGSDTPGPAGRGREDRAASSSGKKPGTRFFSSTCWAGGRPRRRDGLPSTPCSVRTSRNSGPSTKRTVPTKRDVCLRWCRNRPRLQTKSSSASRWISSMCW